MKSALLIPVKDLTNAKTRLSSLLTPDQRKTLAHTMLEGTLDQIARVKTRVSRFMVTSYEPAKILAGQFGLEVIEENEQISESDSVDRASAILEKAGFDLVFRVPLDLPVLDSLDLDAVLSLGESGKKVVLVPSLSGTGTNGILRNPPTLFPSRFGSGSLEKHLNLARERTASIEICNAKSMALDIDDPADLKTLIDSNQENLAKQLIYDWGIADRL